METFVEITEISLKDYYFGAVSPITYTERVISLDNFDLNNVPANVVCFRTFFSLETSNSPKVYSMWIYNGKSISLERLKEILKEVEDAKEENSARLSAALKEQNYLTNPFDKEIAVLKTTDGKLLNLIFNVKKTIKNMESLGVNRACQINNINFYPMDEECITLSEYLEIMRERKLSPEFKKILISQKAMKASIISLITIFKGQNYEYFNHLDENGKWDFSWLDNASKEDVFNLFMSCAQLTIGLKQQYDDQDSIRKQMIDLFSLLVPKKDADSDAEANDIAEGRTFKYITPE